MQIGPVQLLVIAFPTDHPQDELRAELERLRSESTVRLLDLMVVRKHPDGRMERLETSELDDAEAEELGSLVGALVGLSAEGPAAAELGVEGGATAVAEGGSPVDDVWYFDDVLAPGTSAVVALVEHVWAIGLRDTMIDAGATLAVDAWIHPLDLVALRLVDAEDAARELR